jgi:hypothetical protein
MSGKVCKNEPEIITVDVSDNDKQEIAGINLDANREKTLNGQVRTKTTYWQLYSFASKRDWLIMIIGTFFAIISGAVTVRNIIRNIIIII